MRVVGGLSLAGTHTCTTFICLSLKVSPDVLLQRKKTTLQTQRVNKVAPGLFVEKHDGDPKINYTKIDIACICRVSEMSYSKSMQNANPIL